MKEDATIKALRQVKKVFDKHGIEYWLDAGTLLGAVRDGKFIPWDPDIDLGSWDKDFDKIAFACNNFSGKGFEVYFSDQKSHLSILKKNCKIDVTLYRVNNDKATHTWSVHDKIMGQIIDYLLWVLKLRDAGVKESRMPLSITKNLVKFSCALPTWLRKKLVKILQVLYEKIGSRRVNLAIPNHYFMNLPTIKFYGMEFKVPAKAEEYLAYRYGKGWRTPKKDWIYYKDDSAIMKNKM